MTPLRWLANWAVRHRYLIAAFLLLTLPPIAVSAYSLNWIRQRHEILEGRVAPIYRFSKEETEAPGLLRFFGEQGIPVLHVVPHHCYREDFENAKRLFPETEFEPHFPGMSATRWEMPWYPPRPKSNLDNTDSSRY